MKRAQFYFETLKDTVSAFGDSNASRDAMTVAYCALFSIPGLLIIIIWIAALFLGEEAIRGEITSQISGVMGDEVAQSIQQMITDSLIDKESLLMKAIGILSLVFGATTLFFQLQKALNDLWNVKVKPEKALHKFLLDRANSFGIIVFICFLMMFTMVLSSFISYFNTLITSYFGLETYNTIQIINFAVGFLLIIIIFAVIFKILPDVEMKWNSVWFGAFITAVLFTIGKFLLSLYFTQVKPTSVFGTAGTVVLIMLWVNYSCMILFFGAIFTKIFAEKKGYSFKPARHAEWQNYPLAENS